MQSLRLLCLPPEATAADIDRAMIAIRNTVADRGRVRELQNAAYFAKTHRRLKKRKRSQRRVNRLLIIASVTLVALAVFSGFQLSTRFRHHFVEFEPGNALHRLDDGTRFGVVIGFEKSHLFPNGMRRDAYNVILHPDDKLAWISANTAQSALTTKP